jgi:hypothetical protein
MIYNTKTTTMSAARLLLSLLFVIICYIVRAQTDTVSQNLHQIPLKYILQVDRKIDKYTGRITGKTERTLAKLSKWENKIHSLLIKIDPEAAQRLFANDQLTFSAALEKYKKGEAIIAERKLQYDAYRDKLTNSLEYLAQQKEKVDEKLIVPIKDAKQKAGELDKQEANTESVEQFIKERKKKLIDESIKYIGNSKYLSKINKESYYYLETLKNYKAIFQDEKKGEQTVINILNKIPAFKKFVNQNSMLAKLFGTPDAVASSASLAGLQTRASVRALIQNQITAGGPNAQEQISANFRAAQAELNTLKDKILKNGSATSDADMPNFKPNGQKTKTFRQRIEFGANFQSTKSNSYLPTTSDLGLSVGYKLNDKSIIGLGASYKLGFGKDINHIQLSSEGAGLRSFVDYKLKKSFWLSGGAEMNYLNRFNNIVNLKNLTAWQTSALLGLTKKYGIGKKIKGNMQLLYDFFYQQNIPVRQPIVFRIGYSF